MVYVYRDDLTLQAQRFHLATIETISTTRAGLFIDGHLKVREGEHGLDILLSQHLQEAAAATAVIMGKGASPDAYKIPVFRADHPFIFLIQDNTSGNILFIGRVENPTG